MPNVTLSWDAMPGTEVWKEVRILEGATVVATAAMPAASVVVANVTKAPHTFVARSFDGTFESDDSNAVVVTPPVPPGHLKR